VKCGYCDFHSLPTKRDEIPHHAYTQAVIKQLHSLVPLYSLQGRKVDAVFFGGGTPSLMDSSFFENVLNELHKIFSFSADIEITSEMNPMGGAVQSVRADETSQRTSAIDWLKSVQKAGVNRLSIGIQSFNPKYLTFLDRDHTADDVQHVLIDAREAGFQNLSCDLIYSIPGQTTKEVEDDIRRALSFEPDHISAYQLTFEPGTLLEKRYRDLSSLRRQGSHDSQEIPASAGMTKMFPPKLDDETSLEQFRLVHQLLDKAGLHRYEISNFARPSFESRHNLNYWRYGEYLGLGSGAVSFLSSPCAAVQTFVSTDQLDRAHKGQADRRIAERFTTTRNVHRYLEGDFEPKDVDVIDHKTAMAEFCFLGLRTREGISLSEFEKRFGVSLESVYPGLTKKLEQQKLLLRHENSFTLTFLGIELSNEVFRHFL